MVWDFADYSGEDETPSLPLLLSERSQQLLLAVIKSMQSEYVWITDDYDETDAAVSEAIYELSNPSMPDFTPVGTIVAYAGTIASIPDKWQICDGHLLDVDDYPDLRDVLDTPFDDNTFLTVPDLRDKFIYGMGTSSSLGATGGAATVALAINELPAHTHTVGAADGTGNAARAARGSAVNIGTFASGSVGSGAAHQNLPPFMRLYYIMKVLP